MKKNVTENEDHNRKEGQVWFLRIGWGRREKNSLGIRVAMIPGVGDLELALFSSRV